MLNQPLLCFYKPDKVRGDIKMKLHDMLFLVLLALISPLAVTADSISDKAEINKLNNSEMFGRILLIGFPDQHINRIQRAPLTYRHRGGYRSSTWSKRISTQLEDEYRLQKITEWPMTEIGVHCAVYLVPSNQSVAKTITLLEMDKRVQIVQKIHLFKTRTQHYNDPYFKLQSNLHTMQINQVHGITTGRNVNIAMIDTGVDLEHPDLAGQIEINKNFASGISSSFSSDMHGTAVAGIIVARKDNETGIIGVAPNASLLALKACWPDQPDNFEAICNSFTLALAVNAAIKLGVKVLNLSLSGPQDPLLELLLNKAIANGIIVIAADPGIDRDDRQRFPASLKNVIPVQTLRMSGLNDMSHKNSISAPGENILTTLPHGTYDYVSGSSLSAAMVSGVVALLLELKPDLSRDEIINILQKSVLSTNSAAQEGLAYGINANTAVMEICKTIGCSEKL